MNANHVRISGPNHSPLPALSSSGPMAIVFTVFVFTAFFQELGFLAEHVKKFHPQIKCILTHKA